MNAAGLPGPEPAQPPWPSSDSLLVDVAGSVLVCTINRPERGNALRDGEMSMLADVFERASSSGGAEARSVLLRSNGRHFCAGADISGALDGGRRPAIGHLTRTLGTGAHRLVTAIWECNLPVVAAVQGRAAGLGCHLALACDFAVAAQTASFAEPFVRRGFTPDSGATYLLPRLIGVARAKEMLLRGGSVTAQMAAEWGLVSSVVPDGELDGTARALAQELAAGATFSIGLAKQLIHRHLQSDLAAALVGEAQAVELSVRSDDFKEGMRAFAEKREPSFEGR